jgi:hypothetical protein
MYGPLRGGGSIENLDMYTHRFLNVLVEMLH